jgi:hypothetical protein
MRGKQWANALTFRDRLRLAKQFREVVVPKRLKTARKKTVSPSEFEAEFIRIATNHLAKLPPEEQDERLDAAYRRVSRSRGVSSITRGSREARGNRRSAQARD